MTAIAAHVQHRQQQMCSVRTAAMQCYPPVMQPEQRIIANWMEAVRERLGWSYKLWAERAGLGAATTLTRAIKPDYDSVTNVKTLHALAEAAGERSILDFLAAQTAGQDKPAVSAPSAETLAALLGAILPLVPTGVVSDRSLRALGEALRHGLELLGDQQTSPEQGALGVASRGVIARFRDLNG